MENLISNHVLLIIGILKCGNLRLEMSMNSDFSMPVVLVIAVLEML